MTILPGYDIANVNGPNAINATSSASFVLFKATEGLNFVDRYHNAWAAVARLRKQLVGFYHFAHLTNDPVAEARFFVANAGALKGEVLALDFEPYGQPVADAAYPGWIVAFLNEVNRLTAAKCWIYLNPDMMRRVLAHATPAQLAVIVAAPHWRASYTSQIDYAGPATPWSGFTAWQYSTSAGIDHNQFFGDANLWFSHGVGGGSTSAPVTLAKPAALTTPTVPIPPKENAMVVVQKTRGVWLFGPNFAHHFNPEEWAAFNLLYVTTGHVPVEVLDSGWIGERQFDLTKNVFTTATK